MVDWKVGDEFIITDFDKTSLGFMRDPHHKEYIGEDPNVVFTVIGVHSDRVTFSPIGYYAYKSCIKPAGSDYDLW